MFDIIIRGGIVVDGTGAAPFASDVGVRDGKIVASETSGSSPSSVSVSYLEP